MSRRSTAIGAALLLAGALCLLLYSITLAQVERGDPEGTATPEAAAPVSGATPTPDRLAAPPTVIAPNQADEGAQLFWLYCQPCHGDRGQGLTDEWRAQYPPDDQNCWESGCHGDRPYDPAFKLPTAVPAVIGDGTLQKFETMDALYGYVSVAMPYFFPGDLTQEEYLAILAHMARENGVWDGAPLTTGNLADYRLRPAAVVTEISSGTGHLAQATAAPPSATDVPPDSVPGLGSVELGLLGLCALVVITVLIGGVLLWRNRSR